MARKTARMGRGRFQWSAEEWFGSQLCGTVLLLPAAVECMVRGASWGALLFLAGFAAANVAGTWLWWRCDRIGPFRATMLLLLICVVSAAPGLFIGSNLGNESVNLREMSVCELAFVGLVACFSFKEWAGRKQRSPLAGREKPDRDPASPASLWDRDLDSASSGIG